MRAYVVHATVYENGAEKNVSTAWDVKTDPQRFPNREHFVSASLKTLMETYGEWGIADYDVQEVS